MRLCRQRDTHGGSQGPLPTPSPSPSPAPVPLPIPLRAGSGHPKSLMSNSLQTAAPQPSEDLTESQRARAARPARDTEIHAAQSKPPPLPPPSPPLPRTRPFQSPAKRRCPCPQPLTSAREAAAALSQQPPHRGSAAVRPVGALHAAAQRSSMARWRQRPGAQSAAGSKLQRRGGRLGARSLLPSLPLPARGPAVRGLSGSLSHLGEEGRGPAGREGLRGRSSKVQLFAGVQGGGGPEPDARATPPPVAAGTGHAWGARSVAHTAPGRHKTGASPGQLPFLKGHHGSALA